MCGVFDKKKGRFTQADYVWLNMLNSLDTTGRFVKSELYLRDFERIVNNFA